ncbi:MAG: hypothetical protein QM737_02835 [Ferruginibacter sp.]
MKRIFRIIVVIIVSMLIMTSCKQQAKSEVQEGNFKVELLFTKDGCDVYRFKDGAIYVYWSNCEGNIKSVVPQIIKAGKTNAVTNIETQTITTKN